VIPPVTYCVGLALAVVLHGIDLFDWYTQRRHIHRDGKPLSAE
jgi:hypothetical protein